MGGQNVVKKGLFRLKKSSKCLSMPKEFGIQGAELCVCSLSLQGGLLDSKDQKLVIFPHECYARQELNLTMRRYAHGHTADTAALSAHCGRLYLLRELG